MEKHVEGRGYITHVYYTYNSQHLKLGDLKEKARERDLVNKRLFKEYIPAYPRPEFHVTHLKHDTTGAGLEGIRRDNGFRDPDPEESPRLLWWSLMVRPEDIQSAERRLLEQIYPDRTEEQIQKQQSFLGKFATSPAFLDSSRLGSYRFTFPLEELLTAYSQQLCSGAQPVMRVFKTFLYKQKVMYAVLVHSPANQELFSEYPLLTDDPNAICAYRDGRFIWRPEAMCGTHSQELVLRQDEKQVEVMELFGRDCEFYVWDDVAIALHVEDGQVLTFGSDRLRENLTYCETGTRLIRPEEEFRDFEEATDLVKELWPKYPSPLERSLNIHAT
ncbi:uncharacterized protein LOC121910868 isoform X2 [Thunnus maccoyii]|uniref:uncharacterized protein LOC121910868 isoform X2 n=1 Tax=Thunnus maccoyii TaxID=8240 RepID=UPI001C4D4C7B|nr:uncharacterized protein LOC121910868 isoform X2 [Thunnus maccoyii]